ncbi:MAG: 16S rRNA (cytosine(1402)-N(4))-methyltransferase RsmH [Bacilli bacterium]
MEHIPVLLNECIDLLNIKSDGIYVDLTLGRGGHSSKILSKLNDKGLLIGIDQDETAINESRPLLESISNRFILVKSNFVNIDKILKQLNIEHVDGILMDLGVSSPQLDDGSRGFSYQKDDVLDMRMDSSNPLTAEKVINTYSLKELYRVFNEYGEDKFSYQIAKNICKEREKQPIKTTFQLVDIIKRSKPDKELKKIGHPAKQIFQALRIEVNDELNVLKETLNKSINLLNKNGRLVVITFHSLEDRITKNIFKDYAVEEGNRIDIPLQGIETKQYRLVNRKVIVPTQEEIERNHRSKSAKVRAIEKK